MSQRFLAHLLMPLSVALAISCSAQNNSSESNYAPGTGPLATTRGGSKAG